MKDTLNTVYYDLKSIKCEICNEIYPYLIEYNGIKDYLFETDFDVTRPRVVMILYEKVFKEAKGVICLYLDTLKNSYTIGRNNSNDIVIDDMSVSRVHSKLVVTKNKVYIMD